MTIKGYTILLQLRASAIITLAIGIIKHGEFRPNHKSREGICFYDPNLAAGSAGEVPDRGSVSCSNSVKVNQEPESEAFSEVSR